MHDPQKSDRDRHYVIEMWTSAMALSKLPKELLSMIYRYLLNGLDITTISEFYNPEVEAANYPAKSYILDPATLRLIRCYREEVFAATLEWHNPMWEHHVRFVFPSVLEMADVLTTYQANGRLDQVRKIKVLDKGFVRYMDSDVRRLLCYDVKTLLYVFPDLRLDHLEYEYTHPLLHDYRNRPGLAVWSGLSAVFATPNWKKLSVLVPQHHFNQHGLDLMVQEFEKLARTDHTDNYIFELPCTPTIKDASGKIIGLDTTRRPTDVEQKYWDGDYQGGNYEASDPSNFPVPSWLGGKPVCTEIVIKRERYGIRAPPSPFRDEIDLMREWYRMTCSFGKPSAEG